MKAAGRKRYAWNTFLKSIDSLDKLDINDPEKPGSWKSKAAYREGTELG